MSAVMSTLGLEPRIGLRSAFWQRGNLKNSTLHRMGSWPTTNNTADGQESVLETVRFSNFFGFQSASNRLWSSTWSIALSESNIHDHAMTTRQMVMNVRFWLYDNSKNEPSIGFGLDLDWIQWPEKIWALRFDGSSYPKKRFPTTS